MTERSLMKIETALSAQVALTGTIKDALVAEEYEPLENLFVTQDMGLQYLLALQGRISHTIALGLYSLQGLWDKIDMDFLRECWDKNPWSPEFDYTFERYATGRTGRQWVTIDNWIRTARVWLSGEYDERFPETVRLIDPKTGETGETVVFDPWAVDASKLQVCRHALTADKMTETAWGLVANPEASFHVIRDHVNLGFEPGRDHQRLEDVSGREMFLQPPFLMVQETGGESKKVAELEWDTDDELVEWAMIRIVDLLGLEIRHGI